MREPALNSGRLVILAGGVSSRMKESSSVENQIPKKILNEAFNKPKSMIGIGEQGRPFLDYLLLNAKDAGYSEIVIVINEKDHSIKEYYERDSGDSFIYDLKISFAFQLIPEGRTKPLGTADALLNALHSKPEWIGKKFTVCNSDNLYSREVLQLMNESAYENALIDYDRDFLGVEPERVEKFAITIKDDEGFLFDIIEKPNAEQVGKSQEQFGYIGVSMNIFSFTYDSILPFLEIVPIDELRNEKELPTAVKLMIQQKPKCLYCFKRKEAVPDLTSKSDILKVQKFLEGKFQNI